MSINRLARRTGRIGVVAAVAGLAVLLGGGTATAHVTARVIGEDAKQGGFAKITFRVPNEDATAGTVKLEVKFPAETPIASLGTKAVPGWSAQVTKAKLDKPIKSHDTEITEAVSVITWTANPGVRIGPGEFAEFEVSGGPLPEADRLVIPALQTYENGKVVSWIEAPPAAGAEEPEHPAPVIALKKGGENGDTAAAANAGAAPAGGQQAAGTGTAATSGTDTTARWIAGAGLAIGALGLGVAAGAIMRSRRIVATAKAGEQS